MKGLGFAFFRILETGDAKKWFHKKVSIPWRKKKGKRKSEGRKHTFAAVAEKDNSSAGFALVVFRYAMTAWKKTYGD